MAHFAQLDENNVVTQVIVVGNSDTADVNGVESEALVLLSVSHFSVLKPTGSRPLIMVI